MAILAAIGYGIGTIKMPTSGNTKISKNVGGDSLDEIILNYIKFKKNKKFILTQYQEKIQTIWKVTIN